MDNNNNDIPIIGSGGQRKAITLRFTQHDLNLFTDIIEYTQGHRDLKKGFHTIIVTVMHTALQNLKKQAAEQAAAERKSSEQEAGAVSRDSKEAQLGTDVDSPARSERESSTGESNDSSKP